MDIHSITFISNLYDEKCVMNTDIYIRARWVILKIALNKKHVMINIALWYIIHNIQ